MPKGYVYILEDDSNAYYIGSTVDIALRFQQHLRGHTVTTSRMNNLVLKLQQEYSTLKDARTVERKIKKLKRKDYIKKMISDGYISIRP